MWNSYVYRKSMRRYRLRSLRRRLGLILLALFFLWLVYSVIAWDIHRGKNKPAVSEKNTLIVSGDLQTFRSTYFQFQDTGKWVLKSDESSTDKSIYYKYRGLSVEHQLIVYVNQVPTPNDLVASRVLPVRVVNGNSLDVTSISGPCGNTYGPQELHKVKTVNLNGANMLCDPDTPQFSVVLSEIGGDYQLHLQRLSGAPVQFVVTYRDLRLNTGPETIMRIANSFQAL